MLENIRPLPPALAKKVKELNEDPESLEIYVAAIHEWIKQTPHLIASPRDQLLVSYLRACRYDVEKVKKKYEAQITARTELSSIFYGRDIHDERYQDILRLGFIIPLPSRVTEDGPTIILSRLGAYDTKQYDYEEVAKVYTTQHDVVLHEDDYFAISGYTLIYDFSNVGLSFAWQIKPTFLMKTFHYFQKSSPFTIVSIHIINMSYALEFLLTLAKSFLSSKTLNKIHVHRDLESLYKYIPQRVLPKEYGGESPCIEECVNMYLEQLESNTDLLNELDQNYIRISKESDSLEYCTI